MTAASASVPAVAQDQDTASVETVVVTGSRIRSANLEGTTPVTQVTSQDIATQGVTRVEDLVNQLPQAFAAQNANIANGASGAATINLRGLGSPRTLVLIDGRRLPYGSVTNSAPDINTIPASIIERVDVLTGGASAVYGSDAVAGVVNFITKKDFEGVQVEAQYGFYQHKNDYGGPGAVKLRDVIAGRAATNPSQFALPESNVTDGYGKSISIMMGLSSADGRGNIMVYGGIDDQDQVLQRDRDYSACSLGANPTVSFSCGGSGTAYPGTFTDFGANNNGGPGPDGIPNTADDIPDTNPLPSFNFTVDRTTGQFRPFSNNLDQYNFGPVNHYLRPSRRYNLGAMGHYEVNDHADVYTQLMYTNYRSIAQIAPGGIFFDASTINCDNPLLSAQQFDAIGCNLVGATDSVPMYIGRRNVEGGGRQQSFRNAMFRGVVGVRGDISPMWQYDVSAQFSSTSANNETLNYFVIDRISRALDVVDVGGTPTCRSVVDGTDPDCRPYNPFDPAGVTQDALNYLQAPGLQTGTIDQEVYVGQVTGDLGWTVPTAAESIKVAFGAEYRKDTLSNTVDALQSAAQLSGSGGATIGISGSTKVVDLFTEAHVPLVQDKPGFDQLSVDGAYRYSDYGKITTDTYKIGLDWAPVRDVRLRGSFQRAVRAANVVELFTAQGFNLFDADGDPCGPAGTDLPGNPDATLAECVATGMPASQYRSPTLNSPAGQYNFLQGGNPGLTPEKSDTQTFGVILQPRFLPKFTMSVDWFNIKIEDTISTIGTNVTLDACYTNNDPVSCARIQRNPANGSLWVGDGHVIDLNTNIGSLETTGYDVNMSYSGLEIGRAGSLSFNLTGTYLEELVTDPGSVGTTPYDCAGKFSSSCASGTAGVPSPRWRHHARIGWQTPWPLDVSLTWRYFSEVSQFGLPSTSARIDRVLDAQSYFDLAGNWAITDKASVLVGINNVLDEDPPLSSSVGTTGNGNTYPQLYDSLGRFMFIRGKLSF
ncbi:MAG: TonB-dependent receptor [Steroidobacteraceae bacterium]|nr:TonB-dependent receptor [Steroidobacteraceae bacterium]